jgi:linoleoyl-CoA desaturase
MSKTELQLPIVRFARDTTGFSKELRKRIDAYFEENGGNRHANAFMVFKTVFYATLMFLPWGLMAFGVLGTGWMFWAAYLLMGAGMAGIGMNVMHDANHKAYSSKSWVNNVISRSIEFIGGNAEMWRIQHNVLHHSFTNIDGLDDDINPGAVLRFSPLKPRYKIHRYQHFYAWFFYGLMTLVWAIHKDFLQLFSYKKQGLLKRSGGKFGRLLILMILTKVAFYGYTMALPIMYSGAGIGQVIGGWLLMHFVAGVLLGIIFQPAHVMEDHDYFPAEKGAMIKADVLTHQINTTSNFGVKSRLLTFFSGGLNHQIEHHLFPQVCHIHYPKIAPIVKQTAEEFGIKYRDHVTFWKALYLHGSMLKHLGRA